MEVTVSILQEVLPLAMLDALGLSTLALPVWLLLIPSGLRPARVLAYIIAVALTYLAIGLLLLAGASTLRGALQDATESAVGDALIAAVGVALVLAGLIYGLRRPSVRAGGVGAARSGRLSRWRYAVAGDGASKKVLLGVAIASVVVELPTMLPYLVAVDVLDGSGLTWWSQMGVLMLYCLVMVAPALLLLLFRVVAAQAVSPLLVRVSAWLRRGQREDTAWLLAALGVIVLSRTSIFRGGLAIVESL